MPRGEKLSAPSELPSVPSLYPGFDGFQFSDGSTFHVGRLPDSLIWDQGAFEEVWALHPREYHRIIMHGRRVETPRWQQAYGADYHYTGNLNRALPIPAPLEPLHAWARATIEVR